MATESNTKIAGYETTYIVKPDMAEDALKALQARLTSALEGFDGQVVLSEDLGRKKMAYPIAKESRGHYNYMVYTGKGDVVREIERNLRLNDQVIRFLTVNLAKEFNAEEFITKRNEAQAEKTRVRAERERERSERGERGDRGDRGDRDYSRDYSNED